MEYPNPEEGKGALAMAMATADKHGSDVILANDPGESTTQTGAKAQGLGSGIAGTLTHRAVDADRLAIACRHADAWRVLTGNEIGTLFAWWLLRCYRHANPNAELGRGYAACMRAPSNEACVAVGNVYMLASTVSSKMLKSMAHDEGFKVHPSRSMVSCPG